MGKVKISKEMIGLKLNQSPQGDIINKYRISLTERIVRNIAHEIRNPLTNVMLGLEQLKNECPPENETAGIYFDIIKRNCDRINGLITSLVNAAKPAELSKNLQPVNRLVDDALLMVKERLSENNITINKNFDENIPDLNVDPERIRMAFKIILENAIQAMSGINGKLDIETRFESNKFLVSFKDNGIGIKQDDINSIFDPFFRVKSNGAGLGLTLAQNIITSHNGSIKVMSTPGEGATFTVVLNP